VDAVPIGPHVEVLFADALVGEQRLMEVLGQVALLPGHGSSPSVAAVSRRMTGSGTARSTDCA
jgi:hypothetical protein